MKNSQEKFWSESFGQEYSKRNSYEYDEWNSWYKSMYGVTREELNTQFLNESDKNIKILEVGCNVGQQLFGLSKLGFKNLYGIELQASAVKIAHQRFPELNIIQSTGFDLPFKDEHFDLVYTSGVLIHIAPGNLSKIMNEMVRVSNKLIWGFEYYDKDLVEIPYRGNRNVLWKMDYSKKFIDDFKLKEVNSRKVDYVHPDFLGKTDNMYLLKKGDV